MEEKARCQSCAMPLGTPGYYGTNTDGSEVKEYCMFCFKNGGFTNPDMTLQQMVESSVQYMTKNLGFTEENAREMSEKVIPGLRRWQ